MLIDREHFVVGEQAESEFIRLGQVAAVHERRPRHRPKRHQSNLLILGETRLALPHDQRAERQHIGVRPRAGQTVRVPIFEPGKLFTQRQPAIPKIIADAPEVRVLLHMGGGGENGCARRAAQHDGASGAVNRGADGFNFFLMFKIGTAQVIHFHIVNAPRGDEIENGIVIILRAGLGHIHAIHIGIPRAGVVAIGNILGVISRVFDRQIFLHGLTGNSAHEVNAKFEAERMDVIGERLEARAIGRGGEAIDGGLQAAIFVHDQHGVLAVIVILGAGFIPLDVHDDVFPAMRF